MARLDEAASELESIARHLKSAGETGLVRELRAAIRRAVDPVPAEIRAGLKPHLPDPYAAVLAADLSIKVSIRTSDRDPGVTVTVSSLGGGGVKRRRLHRLDDGTLEWPLFGDRGHWYRRRVPPKVFTGPMEAAKPRVRREIGQALNNVETAATRRGT